LGQSGYLDVEATRSFKMKIEHNSQVVELRDIVDQKLTAFILEMVDADCSTDEVAYAIYDVLKKKWLDPAEARRDAREAVPKNLVSDGNEG
jgi:hypothetical protein